MGDRISLAKARAIRANDSYAWNAEELLEDLLADIKAGKIKPKQIAVQWFEDADEVDQAMIGEFGYLIAKCTIAEYFMILEVAKQRMIDMLKGECDT